MRPFKRPPKLLAAEALWDYGLKSLTVRALTMSELRMRLTRRAEEPEDVEKVIAKLKEYGYLNDARFAENFATARRDNQGFGRHRVLRELKQRRVAPGLAEQAVRDSFAEVDETEMIEQFLE